MVKTTKQIVCCMAMLVSSLTSTAMEHQHEHKPSPQFDHNDALQISRAAIGNVLTEHQFTNSRGEPLSLSSLRGKPLIISLIYTSCYHICPTTTKHLKRVINNARATVGTGSFNVLSIGFDVYRDTPEMMQYFADQQQVSEADWHFLSAEQHTIDSLTALLGFQYFESPNGFDHLIQTTLVGPDGDVLQQIYGIEFDMPVLVEPLKKLVAGNYSDQGFLQDITRQIKLFCTVYDPAQDKYRFDYSLIVGSIIGFCCVGLVGYHLVREWRYSASHHA
jgi:protein SCO1